MLPALAPTVPIVHGGVWPFSAQYLIGSQEFPGGFPLLRVSDLVQLPPLPGYLCNKKFEGGTIACGDQLGVLGPGSGQFLPPPGPI